MYSKLTWERDFFLFLDIVFFHYARKENVIFNTVSYLGKGEILSAAFSVVISFPTVELYPGGVS